MQQAYFVTGTDTNVGKTYISQALIRHFVHAGNKTAGMKPIASGCEISRHGIWQGQLVNEDALALYEAGNVKPALDLMNPYRFSPAIAPHIAAQQAGVQIDIDVISSAYRQLAAIADVVVVEGAGGFFVPLNDSETIADLAVKLNLPLVLVVGMRLGCINHALLTVEAIKARGLKLAGWVANHIDPEMPMFEENLASLQQRIDAPCLSVVSWQGDAKDFNF
ncbi:dethiobiotin synthase [Methylotenera sp. G11]|uniref:dethiobiotin synthase n=1 Tax=Methylotenera sp. G11 TaxID=1506585 RepID=UPI0006481B31|nr:dethiobiotin synthase [Methylotenera sp. G11]